LLSAALLSAALLPSQRVAREATRWLQEAERRFQSGDPGAAIVLLERAYRETSWGGCLLNLGMAHHALGDCPQASDYYAQYLDSEPYSERREQVEAALQELQQVCASNRPEPQLLAAVVPPGAIRPLPVSLLEPSAAAPVVAEPTRAPSVTLPDSSPAAEPDTARRTLAIAGFGLAGASATAAMLLMVSGGRYDRQARRLDDAGRNPENDPVARGLDRQGRHANEWALALGTGSLLLLGASAGLWWLGSPNPRAGLTLSLSEGAPQLELRSDF
jgi:hypothetical protein